jgi:hypothetical protein
MTKSNVRIELMTMFIPPSPSQKTSLPNMDSMEPRQVPLYESITFKFVLYPGFVHVALSKFPKFPKFP